MKPWDRQPGETATAYERFVVYLRLGENRSLRAVATKLGKGESYVRQLEKWSSKYEWVRRVEAHDVAELEESIAKRRLMIEGGRQRLLEAKDEAIEVLLEVASDPDAAPTARVSAAREILDRGGLTATKKVELSGPQGGAIQVESVGFIKELDIAALEALEAELGGEDGD